MIAVRVFCRKMDTLGNYDLFLENIRTNSWAVLGLKWNSFMATGWFLFVRLHHIIFYHLFSGSFCHSNHKKCFVFMFQSILDIEGIFWLFAKKNTNIALQIFQNIEIAITLSKIVHMSSSFSHMASFSRHLW